ncbi:MAG TPA: gamma-glutamyl-gamma-aminobutyrate hydrolase family protein [Solirubrobacteraceae bacterium]|nr:gamma-glutamyl-gamma-aminobutyrate hydrolase family protein [Solirubrobacteraceae bacterium]
MPGSRPLIAVTTSEVRAGGQSAATLHADPGQSEMVLGMRYLRALEQAGAIPVVVPPLVGPALDALLDRVDGVCLSGGPDIHPAAYDAGPHERLGPTWCELDRFELALARGADARQLPILAICRGLQVLNVARGGTLHQHLPDLGDGQVVHRQSEAAEVTTHEVQICAGSRLAAIAGAHRLEVNSFHHQAVDQLGEGLLVTARATDGTVEGLEASDRAFTLAVQWHAESLTGGEPHAALFAALVDSATQLAPSLASAA